MRQEVFSLTATKYGDGKFDIETAQTLNKLDAFNLAAALAFIIKAMREISAEQIATLKKEHGQEAANEFADYFEQALDAKSKLHIRLDKDGLLVERQAR
jgi:NH3-dependent NAD+ synthetase